MKKQVELDSLVLGGQWEVCVRFKYDHKLIEIAKSLRMRFNPRYKIWHVKEYRHTKHNVIYEFGRYATVVATDMTKTINLTPTANEVTKIDLQLNDLAKKHLKRYDGILSNKRYSPRTRKSYISMLQMFFSFYSDMDPLSLTMDDLGKFNNDYIIANNYSVNTQRQMVSAIKLFYENTPNHAMAIEDLIRPKKSRKIPIILEKVRLKQ